MKFFQNSQPEWIRTTDLAAPNGALYQLSYRLKLAGKAGFEPAISRALTVPWHTRLADNPM